MSQLERGASIIKTAAQDLPNTAGVYRMLDKNGHALYVGKAKALKRRVLSYVKIEGLPVRLKRMVAATESMEFLHTSNEIEALLLESNLIKKIKPRYNILLRDDKSFPYILLREDHDFAQIVKHRGERDTKGIYYGPFSGAGDVNRTIIALQKAFLIRNCSDHVFASKKRPCLQYHIKRCSAPCVNLVSKSEYDTHIRQARDFLDGKSADVQKTLASQMEVASAEERFEDAALLRDRIKAMTSIQSRQDINLGGVGDVDVFAAHASSWQVCVQAIFVRGGQILGGRAYFPRHGKEDALDSVLSSFVAQFYENKPVPKVIIVSCEIKDAQLLSDAFSSRGERKVEIVFPKRGVRKTLLEFAEKNALEASQKAVAKRVNEASCVKKLADLLGMKSLPKRIEVYDNSHTSGKEMVGAMIVANKDGFVKNAYRKFNIKHAAASDDYGAMLEVLSRRLKGGQNLPDIIIVDGGAGQLSVTKRALSEAGLDIKIVAIAKGEGRNTGDESLIMPDKEAVHLTHNDALLHYMQRLRDEAHRFAITTHRAKRQARAHTSELDEISGIGAVRKRALLRHFGSTKAVFEASACDIEAVGGISKSLASKIAGLLRNYSRST